MAAVRKVIPLMLILAVIIQEGLLSSPLAQLFQVKYCNSQIAISQTANTTVVVGIAGQKIYICSILLISATAQSLSLVEGTGTACGTGKVAIIGGTNASISVIDQGGFSAISPFGWLSTVSGNNLCLLQSGTGNISGVITYKQMY